MEYILSSNEMSLIDNKTSTELGIDAFTLMERAALETAHFIIDELECESIAIVAGSGNNGGDGIALARILLEYGKKADVYFIGDLDHASSLTKRQIEIATKLSVKIYYGLTFENNKYDLIVDSIFGIGLNREITGIYKEAIDFINHYNVKKLAIDIPSGINADTGKIMGCATKCDYTLTYGAKKTGQILYPGRDYCGIIICKKIGIPVNGYFGKFNTFIYDDSDVILPQRLSYGNKGTFGKVLLIAGSKNIAGAALLSAKAVLRSGAGMVKILTAAENRDLILKVLPEAMVDIYESEIEFESKISSSLNWCDCVAVGPGLSTDSLSVNILGYLLEILDKRTVFDADALNIISDNEKYLESIKNSKYEAIFTPHIGEFSRLIKKNITSIKENFVEYSKSFAKENNIILACKDACTVVTDGEKVFLNTKGNDGMATAGSGDVLTGIITSFLAQGESAFDATSKGVFVHGLAGDIAKHNSSAYYIIANDIIDSLAKII